MPGVEEPRFTPSKWQGSGEIPLDPDQDIIFNFEDPEGVIPLRIAGIDYLRLLHATHTPIPPELAYERNPLDETHVDPLHADINEQPVEVQTSVGNVRTVLIKIDEYGTTLPLRKRTAVLLGVDLVTGDFAAGPASAGHNPPPDFPTMTSTQAKEAMNEANNGNQDKGRMLHGALTKGGASQFHHDTEQAIIDHGGDNHRRDVYEEGGWFTENPRVLKPTVEQLNVWPIANSQEPSPEDDIPWIDEYPKAA